MNTLKNTLDDEQDPDYATLVSPDQSQQKAFEKNARANTAQKISAIIDREFSKEIDKKEKEVLLIQDRLDNALKTLHLLRHAIITDYYNRRQCQATEVGESKQTRIHPAVKSLIGKSPRSIRTQFIDVAIPSTSKDPRFLAPETSCDKKSVASENNSRKQSEKRPQYDSSEREPPKKVPRYVPPKSAIPEPPCPSRGIQHKVRKRIVVGNISKWIPPDWREDAASHKWTMYVRGSKEDADIGNFLAKVRFFLHPSYRPNDVVEVTSPPFHLSRRGWGEFPLRVQLHFKNSMNKPIDIIHHLKLDRTYTGLQTLGSETVVDIWIETSKTSLETSKSLSLQEPTPDFFESKHEPEVSKKEEEEIPNLKCFVEMDHDYCYMTSGSTETVLKNGLNLEKMQPLQISIPQPFQPQAKISILKNKKIKINASNSILLNANFSEPALKIADKSRIVKKEKYQEVMRPIDDVRLNDTLSLVKFIMKRLPLITDDATDPEYIRLHPYACRSKEEFLSHNIGKQRAFEWQRAKEVRSLLKRKVSEEQLWTVKEIIIWARLHAYTPVSIVTSAEQSSGKEAAKTPSSSNSILSTVTAPVDLYKWLSSQNVEGNNQDCESDEEIDIFSTQEEKPSDNQRLVDVEVSKETIFLELPKESESFYMSVTETTREIGIKLTDEEIVPGVRHPSASHVLMQAVQCFAEDLLRLSHAKACERSKNSTVESINVEDVRQALLGREEFDLFTNDGLGMQQSGED